MSFVSYLEYELSHVTDAGCVCGACCGAAGEGDGGTGDGRARPGDPVALRIERLIELGVTVGRGAADDPDADQPKDQNAGRISFAVDDVLGDEDQGIDGLTSGVVWNTTALTFSFPDSASDYEQPYSSNNEPSTFEAFTQQQKDAAYFSFAAYSAISALTFTELGDDAGENDADADLRLAESTARSTAWAYYPSSNPVGGDMWFRSGNFETPAVGGYQFATFLHEMGHALGLKHGHDTSGPGAVPTDLDSMEFTVMTYRSYVGHDLDLYPYYTNDSVSFAQSLMMLDIAAIQRMYGANHGFRSGDTVYSFSTTTGEMFVDGFSELAGTGMGMAGNRVFRTIWDGDGTDTYDFSNYTTALEIDLAPGGHVDLDRTGNFQRADISRFGDAAAPLARGHVFNALLHEGDTRSLIENAIGGSGADIFRGNDAANAFTGGAGDDIFYASAGSDTYDGGAGTDQLVMDGLFTSFAFSVSGAFLQIIDSAIDWVADTVETILFTDETWDFGALYAAASGNAPPVAADDAFSVGEDAVLTGNVLANDSDADGDPLSVTAVNGESVSVGVEIALASGALLTVNANGSFSYDQNGAFDTLDEGETAVDSFTYTAGDGIGGDGATVTITIDGAFDNAIPVASDDAAGGSEGALIQGDVLANDSDGNGDALSVTALNGMAVVGVQTLLASGALLTLNADGSFAYDQNGIFDALGAGESGQDSFIYTVADGRGGTDSATVTLTVDGSDGAGIAEPLLIDFESGPGAAMTPEGTVVLSGLTVEADTSVYGSANALTDATGSFTVTAADGDFDLTAMSLLSISGKLAVTISAYDDGALVGMDSFNVFANRISDRAFGQVFESIDEVRVVADGALRVDDLGVTTYAAPPQPQPTAGDDTLTGTAADDVLDGLAGDDVIVGLAGNDHLIGGEGADRLDGRRGDDTVEGGAGDDVVLVTEAGLGGDHHDGGAGSDTIDWSALTLTGHAFNLTSQTASDGLVQQAMLGFEHIVGSQGADDVRGDAAANTLDGQGGDDFLKGFDGADLLIGGGGLDVLDGGDGDDRLEGGAGFDRVVGGRGADSLFGGEGDDFLRGDQQDDLLEGGAGADRLLGNGGADTAFGGLGNDVLDGGGGVFDDALFGGDGIDRMFGREGDDTLVGGAGNDKLRGDAGADRFVFAAGDGIDLIIDWENGIDLIDLSGHAGFGAIGDVLAVARQVDTRVFIGAQGASDVIVLRDALLGDLDASDFLFA